MEDGDAVAAAVALLLLGTQTRAADKRRRVRMAWGGVGRGAAMAAVTAAIV